MAYQKKSYVEHVAVWVKDIDWHIRFFHDVLGMSMREVDGPSDAPKQFWTIGGMQFISAPDFQGPEGRLAHLGIMVEDLEVALAEAQGWNVQQMAQGPNWLRLPDGLAVELIQASGNAVAEALAVNPRA